MELIIIYPKPYSIYLRGTTFLGGAAGSVELKAAVRYIGVSQHYPALIETRRRIVLL